jgi:NTE family protein
MHEEFTGRGLWRWIPGGGYWRLARLLRHGALRDMIARRATARRLEDLPKRLCVTASDLVSGEAVVFDRGPVAHAVMASMSLPGLAPPVADGRRLLIDGSILNDLPVRELRERGADVVIAVELSAAHVHAPPPSDARMKTSRVLLRSWQLQQQRLAMNQAKDADVLIQPDLSQSNMADFSKLGQIVEIGAAAAYRALDTVMAHIVCVGAAGRHGEQPQLRGNRPACQLAKRRPACPQVGVFGVSAT